MADESRTAGIGIGEGGGDSFDDTFCACTREKSPEHIPRMQRNRRNVIYIRCVTRRLISDI